MMCSVERLVSTHGRTTRPCVTTDPDVLNLHMVGKCDVGRTGRIVDRGGMIFDLVRTKVESNVRWDVRWPSTRIFDNVRLSVGR